MTSLFSCISTMLLVLLMALAIACPQADARAFFVFGDSLVDIGNNNYLLTIARADYPPYGIDAPNHLPTGRFSNGLNIADLIGQAIGSEPLLPSLSPELQGDQLLNGANFASAGVGILDDTGLQFFHILKMSAQLESFRAYQQKLIAHIGEDRAQELVTNALYLVTVGGNDFVNNYFLPSFRTYQFSVPAYVNLLISEFDKLLTKLYDLGARRVLVTATGPLGCAPAELCFRSTNGECASDVQEAVNLFNPQLDALLKRLNSRYEADIFITANMEQINYDFLNNPQYYGFKEAKVACCGQGPYNGFGFCTIASNLCPNREEYVFWDAFHPTEKANKLIVQQILNGTIQYMSPMNLSTIMAIDSRT